jgi:transcriptional regulator with GAF, ATPase, and Fis domain
MPQPAPYANFFTNLAHQRHVVIDILEQAMKKKRSRASLHFIITPTLTEAFAGQQVPGSKTETGDSDIIIIVTKNEPASKELITALMLKGIRDIYFWNTEKQFAEYITETINRLDEINGILESPLVKNNLIGNSAKWKKFLTRLIEAALYTGGACLLSGETGSGKELAARLIHTLDSRKNKKDLITVDCTTIVTDLAGSEFFGHEKGAYTNAINSREGAFALANNGTLFLDEIGDLPLTLQAELLRVVQEGSYKKVGSNTWQKTSFRLVSASHKNLHQLAAANAFRYDLFYRISDFEIEVPSLHERAEDIPVLARYFLQQCCGGKDVPGFDDNLMEVLVNRAYPGNVRELKQLIKRIALRHVNHTKITPGDLPAEEWLKIKSPGTIKETDTFFTSYQRAILGGAKLKDIKDKAMNDAINAAIELSNGNKSVAAKKLGITVRAIQQFLKTKAASF